VVYSSFAYSDCKYYYRDHDPARVVKEFWERRMYTVGLIFLRVIFMAILGLVRHSIPAVKKSPELILL